MEKLTVDGAELAAGSEGHCGDCELEMLVRG